MITRNQLVLFAALTLFTPLFADAAPPTTAASNKAPIQPLDRIVAIANTEIITQTELNQKMAMVKSQLQQSNTPLPPNNVLEQQVLNNMIMESLQLQLAKKLQINVSSSDISNAIDHIAASNNLSAAAMKAKIESNGMSWVNYRNEIKKEMTMAKLQQLEISRSIHISDQEVQDIQKQYQNQQQTNQQYHLLNILIPIPDAPSPTQIEAAQAKANTILQKLQQGANFQQMAVAESSGQEALKGGDLDWHSLAELPTAFADQLANKPVGSLIGPIRTGNGFHILKIIATRAGSSAALTSDQAKQLLYRRKFEQGLGQWLQQLRSSVYVKVLL